MNKRIEELAEEANLLGDFVPTKIPGRYAGTIQIAAIEKFAELLIKECIACVATTAEESFHKEDPSASTALVHAVMEIESRLGDLNEQAN